MLQNCGPFRRASLKSYVSQMSTPNPKVVFDDHVAQVLECQGFSWEEDPRSVYDPSQLYASLEKYATDWKQFEFMDACLKQGFREAYKIFAKPKDVNYLSVLNDAHSVTSALKLSKSSGLPMMSKKLESLTYSFDREYQIRLGLKAPNPCVAFKRTQAGNKTRLVWGYPLEMTIMESRFARPLIDHFRKAFSPMAFGITKAELGAYIHRYIVDTPGEIVALDFSGFDTTISKTMIKQAFRIIGTWFTEEDRKTFGLDKVVSYFIKTPIVMPDGNLYRGKEHGVPSGSYFTQMVDSIVNFALMVALSLRFNFGFRVNTRGSKSRECGIFVLGDDVIVNIIQNSPRLGKKVNIEKWGQYLSKFGLRLNVQKTLVGVPHFLGAIWDKGKPDAELSSLVHKAVFPETFRLYGGKPDAGAESVLRSYASNYVSAFRLLPVSGFRYCSRTLDFPDPREVINPTHLSGSDRFLLEESNLLRSSADRAYFPTLAMRLLL